jgi:hypothetical protein
MRHQKKTTIQRPVSPNDKLYLVRIDERDFGHFFINDYIINQKVKELLDTTFDENEVISVEEYDLTGNYGFIGFELTSKNIKTLCDDRSIIEKDHQGLVSSLSYSDFDLFDNEDLIFFPVFCGCCKRGGEEYQDIILTTISNLGY